MLIDMYLKRLRRREGVCDVGRSQGSMWQEWLAEEALGGAGGPPRSGGHPLLPVPRKVFLLRSPGGII